MSPNTINIFAPAKLNLFLHVTGKRPDGYHTLQSLMVFVDIGDNLAISPHDHFEIEVSGRFATSLQNPTDNLVYKAAMLLSEHYKIPPRAKISLTKNLPIAAGIGGGSSDAAATLRGLVRLWNLPESIDMLMPLAQKIGTDVPACLHRKPLWAEGIGEKITPISDVQDMHFVLVNPHVPTPTASVFKNFAGNFSTPVPLSTNVDSVRTYRNDLTDAAIITTPVIRDVLAALSTTRGCLFHRLSGSGATCFGLYDSADAAHHAARTLQKNYPDWWIVSVGMAKP